MNFEGEISIGWAANRALLERLGKNRPRLNDAQRKKLAVLGNKLGRKALAEVATIATPDTILRRLWGRNPERRKHLMSKRRVRAANLPVVGPIKRRRVRWGGVCSVAVLWGCGGRPPLHAGSPSADMAPVDGQSSDHSPRADAAREIGSTGLDASTDDDRRSSSPPDRPAIAGGDAAPTLDARAPDTRDATGPADAGVPKGRPRVLTNVLTGAPWFGTQGVLGMAVDAQNRVYLADGQNVYTVKGQTVAVYLTAAEAGAGLNLAVNEGVGNVDLDEAGLVYVVAGGISNTTAGFATFVLRSSAPHVVETWRDISSMNGVERVAVVSAGHVAVVGRDGMRTFSDTGDQPVYSSRQLLDTEGCATQDLKAAPSGVFLYQPGCNGSPLLRGNVDGSGVGVLYDGASLPQPASNFLCSARDPAGGFYFVAERTDDYSPQLYHISEEASGATGLEVIDTEPTFLVAKKTQTETFGFEFCSLAAARDGTVFLQTYSQLWKVSPP